jgi:hypothetical protein
LTPAATSAKEFADIFETQSIENLAAALSKRHAIFEKVSVFADWIRLRR